MSVGVDKMLFTWLFDGFKYIDYDEEEMLEEFMAISQRITLFNYSDLRDMSFKLYQKVIKNLKDSEKKTPKDVTDGD